MPLRRAEGRCLAYRNAAGECVSEQSPEAVVRFSGSNVETRYPRSSSRYQTIAERNAVTDYVVMFPAERNCQDLWIGVSRDLLVAS